MKKSLFLIAPTIASLVLSGCHTYAKVGLNVDHGGYVEAAKDACNVSTLAEEHSSATTISNDLHGRILPYREGYRDEQDETHTILAQKLKRLDGAVDGSYRMAMASCGSYNACLIRSGYDESQCIDTRDAWDRSREDFNQFAVEMKSLSSYSGGYRRSREPETLAGLRVD